MKAIEKRVREIANTKEWSGDLRVNMTTVIGALHAAIKMLDEERAKNELASEVIEGVLDSLYALPMSIEDFIGKDTYSKLQRFRKL